MKSMEFLFSLEFEESFTLVLTSLSTIVGSLTVTTPVIELIANGVVELDRANVNIPPSGSLA